MYHSIEKAYESPTTQGNRHEHLQRQVCRPAAGAAGQGGTDDTGTRRENGNTRIDIAGLGIGQPATNDYRTAPGIGYSIANFSEKYPSEKVKNRKNLENSEKIFSSPTLENKESGRFSERTLTFFEKKCLPPIAKLIFISYNGRYKAWDISPIAKKRDLKLLKQSQAPSNQPNITRSVTYLDFTAQRYLDKGLFTTTKGI